MNQTYCEWNFAGSGLQYQLLAGPAFIAIFTVSGIILGLLGDLYNRYAYKFMIYYSFCSMISI